MPTITRRIPQGSADLCPLRAMKPRLKHMLESPFAAQKARVKTVPKVLQEVFWGQAVLPHVLTALYACTGDNYKCTAREHFYFFLREDRVYHALSYVLREYLLPSDGRTPKIPNFKTLKEVVPHHRDRMPEYVADWLQMALQAVQFAFARALHQTLLATLP